RSAGAGAGRVAVTPPAPSSAWWSPEPIGEAGGALAFTARPAGPNELWLSDGSASGTVPAAPCPPCVFGETRSARVGGHLFFPGRDAAHGTELWESDGTPAGTRLVADLESGPASTRLQPLTAVGDKLFMGTSTGSSPRLWTVVPGETPLLVAEGVVPGGGAAFKGQLFFQDSLRLWKSDGTAAGTVQVGPSTVITSV